MERFVAVATTDVFYPLVDHPYLQGWIACCNVLSDLHALGIDWCDSLLMILAVSEEMPAEVRLPAAKHMLAGYAAAARSVGARVTGGQTLRNPWPLVGGSATAVCAPGPGNGAGRAHVPQEGLEIGDVLVLTKPLGTQLAVNLHQWRRTRHARWRTLSAPRASGGLGLCAESAHRVYCEAAGSMMTLNAPAARLMHTHAAHGATDVTGFGILGHADALARTAAVNREHAAHLKLSADSAACARARAHVLASGAAPVLGIEFASLPVLAHCLQVDAAVGGGAVFRLRSGYSAETSGGLLVALPDQAAADAYIAALRAETGLEVGWCAGRVVDARAHLAQVADGRVAPPASPHGAAVPLAWLAPELVWHTASFAIPSALLLDGGGDGGPAGSPPPT